MVKFNLHVSQMLMWTHRPDANANTDTEVIKTAASTSVQTTHNYFNLSQKKKNTELHVLFSVCRQEKSHAMTK